MDFFYKQILRAIEQVLPEQIQNVEQIKLTQIKKMEIHYIQFRKQDIYCQRSIGLRDGSKSNLYLKTLEHDLLILENLEIKHDLYALINIFYGMEFQILDLWTPWTTWLIDKRRTHPSWVQESWPQKNDLGIILGSLQKVNPEIIRNRLNLHAFELQTMDTKTLELMIPETIQNKESGIHVICPCPLNPDLSILSIIQGQNNDRLFGRSYLFKKGLDRTKIPGTKIFVISLGNFNSNTITVLNNSKKKELLTFDQDLGMVLPLGYDLRFMKGLTQDTSKIIEIKTYFPKKFVDILDLPDNVDIKIESHGKGLILVKEINKEKLKTELILKNDMYGFDKLCSGTFQKINVIHKRHLVFKFNSDKTSFSFPDFSPKGPNSLDRIPYYSGQGTPCHMIGSMYF